MHLVMIGGSDAGISAALRARELDPGADVTVVLADAYPNFSICGIPYYSYTPPLGSPGKQSRWAPRPGAGPRSGANPPRAPSPGRTSPASAANAGNAGPSET